jgi:hypothetical protein
MFLEIKDRVAAALSLLAPDRLSRPPLLLGSLPQLLLLLRTLPFLGDAVDSGGLLTRLPGSIRPRPVAIDTWLSQPIPLSRLTHLLSCFL